MVVQSGTALAYIPVLPVEADEKRLIKLAYEQVHHASLTDGDGRERLEALRYAILLARNVDALEPEDAAMSFIPELWGPGQLRALVYRVRNDVELAGDWTGADYDDPPDEDEDDDDPDERL